jgi:hypothetical protein
MERAAMSTRKEQFISAGAVLVPDGDGLRIEAPAPLPADLMQHLRERRELMLVRYHESAVSLMLDDDLMTREDADTIAAWQALDVLDGHEVKGKAAGLVTRHYTEIQTTKRTAEDFELMELSQ